MRRAEARWSDLGPPRLDPPGSTSKLPSFAQCILDHFLAMDPAQVDRVMQAYREQYGDGPHAYARRTIASWKKSPAKQVGQTLVRLTEIVPSFVDWETKFRFVQSYRVETLRRLRQSQIKLSVGADQSLEPIATEIEAVISAQLEVKDPPLQFSQARWMDRDEAQLFMQMVIESERRLLLGKADAFLQKVRFMQRLGKEIEIPLHIEAVVELPTALFTLSIVQTKKTDMSHEHETHDETGLLSKWNDLELETRFKSGEVSYPEYVLRNMDQFFTKEEQSELHKIAAMHGLELERLLMEIQIKSRTSEADLQKLLTTLRTLQEKNITAEIVSRHETPSGHIEISARSRPRMGCAPMGSVLLLITVLFLLFG